MIFSTTCRCLSLTLAVALIACTPTKPPQTGPEPVEKKQPEANPEPSDDTPAGGPKDTEVAQLTVDATTEIRVKGVVSQVLGMQLVPPKIVFKVRDNSGEAMAVINEQVSPALSEGQRIELVGHYKVIAAPLHRGGGDAPEEPVFVVDRFLVF